MARTSQSSAPHLMESGGMRVRNLRVTATKAMVATAVTVLTRGADEFRMPVLHVVWYKELPSRDYS